MGASKNPSSAFQKRKFQILIDPKLSVEKIIVIIIRVKICGEDGTRTHDPEYAILVL
jgi:hypothetical protein